MNDKMINDIQSILFSGREKQKKFYDYLMKKYNDAERNAQKYKDIMTLIIDHESQEYKNAHDAYWEYTRDWLNYNDIKNQFKIIIDE